MNIMCYNEPFCVENHHPAVSLKLTSWYIMLNDAQFSFGVSNVFTFCNWRLLIVQMKGSRKEDAFD